MPRRRYLFALLAALPLTASAQLPPAQRIAALEARLLAAQRVEIDFEIAAEGALTAALRGRLRLERQGSLVLEASGQFAGAPVDATLSADARELTIQLSSADALSATRPDALDEAVLVGLVRMGILHNIARLTAASAPDHAAGGVRAWVTLDGHRRDGAGVSFALTVAGEPAGTATLSLDARGLPAQRVQTVAFPEGEMRVTERYLRFDVEP